MRKVLHLAWILFKNTRSPISLGRSVRFRRILLAILFFLAISPLMVQMFSLSYHVFQSLAPIGRIDLGISFGLSAFGQMVFVFGILYVLTVYFYAHDVDYLFPLPFRPGEILAGKFLATLFYEYITAFILLAPLLFAVTFFIQWDFLYFMYALVVFLIAPVIPLSYASILVFVSLRIFPFSKRKDQWGKWGGILSILVILVLNLFFQAFSAKARMGVLSQVFLKTHGSWWAIGLRWAFGSVLASHALSHVHSFQGLLSLLGFCGMSLLIFSVFLLIGNRMYFQFLSHSETLSPTVKKLGLSQIKQLPVWITYGLKEVRIVFREPGFFIHCIVMGLIWPIFFLPVFFFPRTSNAGLDLAELYKLTHSEFFYFVPLVLGMLMSTSNAMASTFLSREGKQVFVMKYLPISFSLQMWAKGASAVTISVLGAFFWFFLFVLFVLPPLEKILASFVLIFLGVGFSVLSGMVLDLLFPKLGEESPHKVVRQNLNISLHLMINVVLAILVGTGIAIFGLSAYCFWLLFLLFLIFDFSLFAFLFKKGEKIFSQLVL